MKITSSYDWRADLAFDAPLPATDVLPGDPSRCAGCPADAGKHDRAQMWAVKHRHPNDPAGIVRLYCSAHVPRVEPPPASPTRSRGSGRTSSKRTATRRTPAAPERPQPVCPDCFVEVAANGICGMCGQRVA